MSARVWVVAVVAGLSMGCPKSVPRELGTPVVTGVVQEFGDPQGPSLSWDFGDGSPAATGPVARHAFARAGRYTVQGSTGGQVKASQLLEVMPRPGLQAIPAAATTAMFAPRLGKDLTRLLDFAERAANPTTVAQRLEELVLPQFVIEASAGGAPAFDGDEAVGLFNLPDPDLLVAFAGVVDEQAAVKTLVARMSEDGALATTAPDGVVRLAWDSGRAAAVFTDRGYLYLVPLGLEQDPFRAVAAVKGSTDRGLSAEGDLVELGDGWVANGLVLAARGDGTGIFGAALATLKVEGDAAQLEGTIAMRRAFDVAKGGAALLEVGPSGPIAGLQLSIDASDIVESFFGSPGNPRRAQSLAKLKQQGLDAEGLAAGLTGEAQLLAWFDADAFFRNVVQGSGRPEPKGAVRLTAPARDEKKLKAVLARWFASDFWEGQVQVAEQGWRVRGGRADVDVEVKEGGLSAETGKALATRPQVNLGEALSERFGGAFGPGRTSVFIDVGQLLKEIETPRQLQGLDATQVVTVQGFTSAFVRQLTSIDHAWLDLEPKGKEVTVKGRLVLRPRQVESQ